LKQIKTKEWKKWRYLPLSEKEKIRKLYWEQGKTPQEIGKIYKCSDKTILRFMNKVGISNRNISEALKLGWAKGKRNRNYKIPLSEKNKIYNLYWNEGLSLIEIGFFYRCSEDSVRSLMKRANIPIKTFSQAAVLAWQKGKRNKKNK